jgi:Protein-tyrosine phosphatase
MYRQRVHCIILLIFLLSLSLYLYSFDSPRTVQLFQLTCWPLGHKVPTSTNSLVELMNMVERWRQKAMGPVCIVSPDGRSRAGVYCAANACIE